jgi:hypothetical protein
MTAFCIEGYVIVSADGMLANAADVMPDELKFKGDKQFFTDALDRADLIVHGRNSFEDQPNSPRRKRIALTRTIASLAPDPSNPKATLWNAPASKAARLRSSAARSCSPCSSTATIRSGSPRRRRCGYRMAKAVFRAFPHNRRRRSWQRTA